MSHIPSTAMPHAHTDGEPPLSAAGPGTATGNREGSAAEATARDAGGAATGGQSRVDGTVTADGDRARAHASGDDDERGPSPAVIVAVLLGGLAAVGGVVAAALPLLNDRKKSKRKKGKKRKG